MSGRRVILKFGSGILTRTDRAEMDEEQLCKLVQAIAELKRRGHAVVVVSSGAVASGLKAMGFRERPQEITTLQACAAVGQTYLMHTYQSYLRGHGLYVAQLLLTHADLESKERAEKVKNTLLRLLENPNVVPIINENDSVAVEELRFGDNDKLSSRVAQLWSADLLILLTSVPGLMDLKNDGAVNIVPMVEDVNSVLHLAQEDKGAFSVGGMASKLRAVADAVAGNVECIIASGRHPEQIADLVEGKGTGTRFPLPASKA
ncbi:glutamate 5-kinase [Verrucomicrobium spinosum]|uniref:glutamate 5-kinase n=1 Tax=Verrucomicrobium spinosum TaxID=2736 RepID=UPI0001746682|nr:glutamate 5-kinase [Verrucomicrobium spinosum]